MTKNRRILIVDDDLSIWRTYQSVLSPKKRAKHIEKFRILAGGAPNPEPGFDFELDFASRGKDAFEWVRKSLESDEPYAMAIIDVRMPPDWDGVETASRIRQIDPEIEIAMVTAYSDFSIKEMVRRIGSPDKLLLLRKPFDLEEIEQIALCMVEKWNLSHVEKGQKRELETLLSSMEAGVFALDSEKRIASWNRAAENITGLKADDVIGGPCPFITEFDNACGECRIDFSNPENACHEIGFLTKEGKKVTVEKRISYILDDSEKPTKALENFWDITVIRAAEKSLTYSEKKYRDIFKNSVEGIFQYLPEGGFLDVNQALARLAGYDNPSEMTQKIRNIKTDLFENADDADKFGALIAKHGKVENFETRFRKKTGGTVDVSLYAREVREGINITYYEGIAVNITDKKRVEKIQMKKEAVETAFKLKNDFITDMSHEIRTPLNAILGYSDLSLKSEPPEKLRDYLEKICHSAKLTTQIINHILDLSSIEAGKTELRLENFNLKDLLKSSYDCFYLKAKKKGIHLGISVDDDIPCHLVGDALRFAQVINNLADNALKFTGENGQIHIDISLVSRSSAHVEIKFSIRDTGIGISKEEMINLFRPFAQAGISLQRREGTGLGLAICKHLVEMMNGTIWVESDPGQGSTFHFTSIFGISTNHEKRDGEPESRVSTIRKIVNIRVLLIEDDIINQTLASDILRTVNAETDVFGNGRDALISARENDYDVVLLDLRLPDMDGFETARVIRDSGKNRNVPIIAMTAHAFSGVREKCLEAGMNDYLAKPIEVDQLLQTIGKWVTTDLKS